MRRCDVSGLGYAIPTGPCMIYVHEKQLQSKRVVLVWQCVGSTVIPSSFL